MSKRLLLERFSLGCLLAIGLAVASCSGHDEIVVAVIDAEEITAADLKRAYQMQSFQYDDFHASDEAIRARKIDVLNALINHRLLLKQAREQKLTIDVTALNEHLNRLRQGYREKKFAAQLTRRGLTVRDWERVQQENFLIHSWMRRQLISQIEIGAAEVKKYYQDHKQDFAQAEQVRALHIFVDSEKQAAFLLEQIEAGEDFAALASQYSRGPEAREGGDLGYFGRSDYPPIFTETCFRLKKGETSEIVRSDYGYHLFKVVGKQRAKKPSFKEVAPQIRRLLTGRRMQESMDQVIQDLRASLQIEIRQEALSEIQL